MIKEDMIAFLNENVLTSEDNRIPADKARRHELAGHRIFDRVVVGVADAADPFFDGFKEPHVIGPTYRTPREWLPGSRSVISYFLPFTEEIRKSNIFDPRLPSDEWLHARIEGQAFINRLSISLCTHLIGEGYDSIVPSTDPSFKQTERREGGTLFFESRWSERHAAYAAGIGTFGLSRGLITKHGMAGRLGSVITVLELEPDIRHYSDPYEYCSLCLACTKRCPVGAITKENGKDQELCSRYVRQMKEQFNPYYGCGKCQVGVPCEARIPVKKKQKMFENDLKTSSRI